MIPLKTEADIVRIRRACEIVSEVLVLLKGLVKPGVGTRELDEKAAGYIKKLGGKSAFKGYHGYPGNICTSVNEEVVHGIPGRRRLEEGDIIGLDVGVELEGYYGDAAVTLPVGKIPGETERLLNVCEEALAIAADKVMPGIALSNISNAIQRYVESNGFSVVRQFVGHGIGKSIHEEPQVPNFGEPNHGPILKPGMVLAIEPMVNMGGPDVKILSDGWTAVTSDGKPSVHFEHTVCVTATGREILTEWQRVSTPMNKSG